MLWQCQIGFILGHFFHSIGLSLDEKVRWHDFLYSLAEKPIEILLHLKLKIGDRLGLLCELHASYEDFGNSAASM